MKLKLIALLVCTVGCLSAEETVPEEKVSQDFGYISLGLGPFPLPLPVFSGGYRFQSGHDGGDFGLQVSTVVAATQIKANLLYHYYLTPSIQSQFYIGAGVGPSVVVGSAVGRQARWFLSPEFVFGKQYQSDAGGPRFFQAQVSFPTVEFRRGHGDQKWYAKDPTWFPLVVISYGIGF